MIKDRERRDDRPAPGRHLVDVEKKPVRQEENLRGHRRHVFPWELPKQGEVEPAIGVHLRNPAETQNVGACFAHPERIRRISSELQREIRLHGGVDFRRAANKNIPTPVCRLAPADVVCAFPLEVRVDASAPMQKDDRVAAQRGIHGKLTLPVSVGLLDREEKFLGSGHRARKFVGSLASGFEWDQIFRGAHFKRISAAC